MVYIKRKTSFFAGGKKQKPFFSDGSFYQVFKSRTPADCRVCKKEGPSIQRPAAWYQKPFFNRRFFFSFFHYSTFEAQKQPAFQVIIFIYFLFLYILND